MLYKSVDKRMLVYQSVKPIRLGQYRVPILLYCLVHGHSCCGFSYSNPHVAMEYNLYIYIS